MAIDRYEQKEYMEVKVPIIFVTNGLYANSKEIVRQFGEKFNCSIITDADIIEKKMQPGKIITAIGLAREWLEKI